VNGRRFGDWRADAVTREMFEAFRRQRPAIAANRDLALLRAAFNWAVLGGLVPATPFKVGTVAAIKLAREEARTRRLQPGEEERLLLAAGGLRDLIIAALETGCRRGELLSLQWSQVRGDLFLPAGKTKAKKPRRVPISTSTVLTQVLDARRNDPAGEPLPADSFVFGDEIGRRRRSIRTAWRLTCKRARLEGLHFHDLRREAGSRWMDAGVPLATIQRWLGHHNISQTSTYLAASGGGDADAMRAFEKTIGRVQIETPAADSTQSGGEAPAPLSPRMLVESSRVH
jgi:integrase